MKKKIVKGLLLATAITSISFISPQQEATAAGTQLREKSAFSYAQLDELKEELKTKNIKLGEKERSVSLKSFHVSIPLSYPKKGVKSDGKHLDTEVDSQRFHLQIKRSNHSRPESIYLLFS